VAKDIAASAVLVAAIAAILVAIAFICIEIPLDQFLIGINKFVFSPIVEYLDGDFMYLYSLCCSGFLANSQNK
jgi:hypothetical protein